MYTLRTGNDVILKQKAIPVTSADDTILDLSEKMLLLCKELGGIGLAAPQIGVSKRVFVIFTGSEQRCIVNPVLSPVSNRGRKIEQEGCLSFPAKRVRVKRWKKVKLTGENPDGTSFEKTYSGMNARVVQHEVDHLNGKCL